MHEVHGKAQVSVQHSIGSWFVLWTVAAGVAMSSQCHGWTDVSAAAAAAALQESLFSAGVWRAGLVGLLWYAGAFPLLFAQHCMVQVRTAWYSS
jgi:hypothetical protein